MANKFEIPLVDDLLDDENVEIISDPSFYTGEELDAPEEGDEEYVPPVTNDTNDSDEVGDSDQDEVVVEEDPTAVGTYKTLVDKGYIEDDGTFDGTFEKLDEAFTGISENVKNDLLSNTNEKGKQIMEYIMNKGHELSDDDIQGFLNLYAQPTEVDNINSAKEVIVAELTSQGFDSDMIESNIDLLESKDDDGTALKELANKYMKASLQDPDQILEEQRQAQAELELAQQEFTVNLYSTIDNNKFPKKTKEAIKANYRSSAYVDRFTEAFTNPESLVQLITLSQYYDPKTKLFDLTEFAKVAASKTIEKLKDNSIRQNYSSSSKGGAKAKGKPNPMDDIQFVNP